MHCCLDDYGSDVTGGTSVEPVDARSCTSTEAVDVLRCTSTAASMHAAARAQRRSMHAAARAPRRRCTQLHEHGGRQSSDAAQAQKDWSLSHSHSTTVSAIAAATNPRAGVAALLPSSSARRNALG